jgi:diguanylate cyclase (GGDEF)-like protein
MQPLEIATTAHLAGSIVLALFFVLLERHDTRPYLRDWMAAWIAQALALGALLAAARWDPPGAYTLYLLLEASHGMLLWLAVRGYAQGQLRWPVRVATLLPLLVWAAAAPFFISNDRLLQSTQLAVLAATHASAAFMLWPLREPTGMGVRFTSNVLALLAALYAGQALLLAYTFRGVTGLHPSLEATPFVVLLLQMLLALGMVLTVMEATQWVLTATNAQLREAENRLKVLAETDPLTGCFNRRVFRVLVDDLRAAGGTLTGAILLLDIDGLKGVNDREGHAAGDQAIREVAEAIRGCTRTTDLLVRWGGDEFVVVLPGASPADGEQRRKQICAAAQEAGHSVSAGLASYGGEVDVMVAVERADALMYDAKVRRKAGASAAPTA